jgi:diguanylate cyclase (GGDEF)-like protein/putative nucleotidyltransferase with HDIG domain
MRTSSSISKPSKWLRLRDVAIDRMGDRDVRWRCLGGLFTAGGSLALASLVVPVDRGSQTFAVMLVGVVAVAAGLAQIAAAGRLPGDDRWLSLALACGTVLITLAVIFNRSAASAYALIYVWVGFEGFFFLSKRAAYGHLVWVGVAYAIALAVTPPAGEAEAGRWLLLMGTVGVIGTLADLLRSRSERLISLLSDAVRTDSLTNLLNRRGFEECLRIEQERARRGGTQLTLVVLDLDYFKLINDRYGHAHGDTVLARFGELAAEIKRAGDHACRIGGEEFALVLPDTAPHGAYLLTERLRRRIREQAEPGGTVSASFGIATYPEHGETADELLKGADQAMYLAKRLGRDRSVIYSAEVSATFPSAPDHRPEAIEHLPAVLVLAETLDMRDTGTASHSQTVGYYAEAIARQLGLPGKRVDRIRLAGLLHDIGKIGVPDPILHKAGPLDDLEWAEMKKHPELGARILSGAGLQDLSEWVLAHHERPDGRGYPLGLHGDDIPLEARILAVADSFEAMTADRVYRPARPRADAVQELRRHIGVQFDAEIVEAFLSAPAIVSPDAVPGSRT